MSAVWLAQVAHHARALAADPPPSAFAAILAVPDPPALVAARLALCDPAVPSPVPALLAAYEARERLYTEAAEAADLERESRAGRLRAVLVRGTTADLRALWEAVDARMGRGVQVPPRGKAEMVAALARRPIAAAL